MRLVLPALALTTVLPVFQQLVFRLRTEAVVVNVSVRAGNRPVPGLTADDFELRDNGVVQAITDISGDTLPLDVVFTLDVSSSLVPAQRSRLAQAVRRVTASLNASDRSGLTVFDRRVVERVPLSPPPIDIDLSPTRTQGKGGTSLLDALAVALMMPGLEGRRQLAILLTDALENASFFDLAFAKDLASRSYGVLDVILSERHTASILRNVQQREIDRLKEIAELTGGRVTPLAGDDLLAPAFMQSIDDLRTSYVLRYTPSGVKPGGWHDISVSVRKSGRFEVRARKGYRND